MNLFLLTLWSTLTFTVMFWDAWEKMCDEKGWKFGVTTTGSITKTCPPKCPWNPQFVTNNNLVIIPHPPYRQDLALCDFALFLKLKMKLKGQRFETVSDIQRESQVYLTALRKMTSTVLLKCGKKRWDTFSKRLFWRRWQTKLSKLSQHFFLVRELSSSTSYQIVSRI
jgi:hypothetical protein